MALRWGICTAGKISHDFLCALSTLEDQSLYPVVAVAARSLERAQKFAELHQIPKAYGSYEELAEDEDVDIVYIGSLNKGHLPHCRLFFNHNKHVLCEKPLALNVKEVKEIISMAKEKNVFFMEALWSRFFPSTLKIKEIISNNQIGEVKIVQASIGISGLLKSIERLAKKELGGGALYEIGIYTVQFALMVFGDEAPSSISIAGHLTEEGVDESANITLHYPGNKMAVLAYSAGDCDLSNEAYVWGSGGNIKVKAPFWCPHEFEVTTKATGKTEQFHFPLPESRIPVILKPFNITGLRYQAEAVRQAINEGKKEHPLMSHEKSVLLATVMEKCRNSLGYVIEGDKSND